MKLRRPTIKRTVQNAIGATIDGSPAALANILEIAGDEENTANTPRRAIAISRPIANAISLPSNHLAIALDTVIPAISQPQPKIIKPNAAILALPGNSGHHELSHKQISDSWKASEIPMYLTAAPTTIKDVDKIPVKRTPILSKMIPATIKKPQTLRINSDAA